MTWNRNSKRDVQLTDHDATPDAMADRRQNEPGGDADRLQND